MSKRQTAQKFSLGQLVSHKKFGIGTVVSFERGANQSQNYGIKFEGGGPQGWADRSTNDISQLIGVARA
jgi:hypothetical protein